MKKVQGIKATNIIKVVMNWQNDGHQNGLFYGTDANCPACGKATEDHLHFLRCTDPLLSRMNKRLISKLLKALHQTRTAGIIALLFKRILLAL